MTGPELGLRLLVVDDDALDRETVRRALRSLAPPPEIVEAASVREAEAQLGDGSSFDCVLLDYFLPEGPSIDFIGRLRELAPHSALVMLTGQGDETVAVELMKAGAADYLSKDSLEPGRLRSAIKFAVALRRAQASAARAKADRDRHASQLRRFVARAPELVAARSLDTLCQITADISLDVLEAGASAIRLQHGDAELCACGPDDAAELSAWAAAMLAAGQISTEPLSDGDHVGVGLMARNGECRGVLAVRCAVGDRSLQEQLVCQLGVLVSISIDNLLLYDSVQRAVRVRDDVMAVVSHDLRTPLNNVRLGASLLRETADDKAVSIIERVDRNVTLMTRLVDDLVDMVRIESGVVELHPSRESVGELLEAARDLVATQAAAAQLKLEISPGAAGLFVRADRERVLQVLANLLGNAVKFTGRDGRIGLAASEQGTVVRFEVSDSGRGIASEEGEKVFARFWQSDPKRRSSGLGLGLYIAKGLIQAHGGALWYESEPGRGTRFFFTLPQASAQQQPQAAVRCDP
ncbi:MAG TPA: hybrid sensor histidine kinase/response regulator [Polyangiales bacterium]|nr:hybrid sensor histidine kinase/response regulator [Polyangiales bacterium]